MGLMRNLVPNTHFVSVHQFHSEVLHRNKTIAKQQVENQMDDIIRFIRKGQRTEMLTNILWVQITFKEQLLKSWGSGCLGHDTSNKSYIYI